MLVVSELLIKIACRSFSMYRLFAWWKRGSFTSDMLRGHSEQSLNDDHARLFERL